MNHMKDVKSVKEQYASTDNLETRITIHAKYSKNKMGFGNWINQHYKFFERCLILEVGCGNGDMWESEAEHLPKGAKLILSDFSEAMVDEVRGKYKNHDNIAFEQINIEEIPYNENSFDFVIANMMLYHVPDLNKALKEIHRVLKPEGIFYAATFGENGINRYLMNALSEYGIYSDINGAFSLQNGKQILKEFFERVEIDYYPDSLEVTETDDLLDYIYSMKSIGNIEKVDRDVMFNIFEGKKDKNGIIKIPKEYGMFIAYK